MFNDNLTFVIFTYNEEKRIERVIKNFKNYGKVLIADNKSTDSTLEIARKHGCDILVRENHYVFVENQEMVNLIYEKIDTDWIYWGFADEMLERNTLEKIQEIIESLKYDVISMDRKNYFYGTFCNDVYNGYNSKFFKKHTIDFTNNPIHGMGRILVSESRVYTMPDKYFVHHFISNTASSYLNVINRYTESEMEFDHKSHKSIWYFVGIFIKFIIRDFFLKRGYKSGFSVIALIELMIFYFLVKNMKSYEKSENLTTPSIEFKNDIVRDKILAAL
jgi:glycosyltransferase involved in cell wall biosynthesis